MMETYEALRAFALGQQADGPPPRGLAAFLRQGMPGWIGVWSRLEWPILSQDPHPREDAWEKVGGFLPDEVALLLAGMALAGRR